MARVIIEKGYYKLGYQNITTGKIINPRWVHDPENGLGIVVEMEGQTFQLYSLTDLRDIIKVIKEVIRILNIPVINEEGDVKTSENK